MKREELEQLAETFEAVIDGNELGAIDPVVRIIIDNGFHHYELDPKEVCSIVLRPLRSKDPTP